MCTAIESYKSLEKELRKVNAGFGKLCIFLEIEDCNFLKNSEDLSPFTIAKEYIKQAPQACWEDIVKYLCEDFLEKELAAKIAKKHNIVLSEYCS